MPPPSYLPCMSEVFQFVHIDRKLTQFGKYSYHFLQLPSIPHDLRPVPFLLPLVYAWKKHQSIASLLDFFQGFLVVEEDCQPQPIDEIPPLINKAIVHKMQGVERNDDGHEGEDPWKANNPKLHS